VRTVDLRGVLADGSIGLAVLGLVGLLLLTRRWWGRALAWVVLLSFVLMTFALYEFVSVFDSLYALSHVGFLSDATFVGGSVLHLRHPILIGVMLVAGSVGVILAQLPRVSWWRGWAVALGLCVLGHAVMPMSHVYDGWRQRHAIHAQASLLPASAKLKSAGTVGAEVQEVFRADLSGKRWLGPLSDRPNVILVMVEAASGAVLPSLAKAAKLKSSASMPRLDALAKRHLLFSQVVAHQRQTNRGEYGILCGDYPKLLSDQSKMTEQVYGDARRCLPAALRDEGYTTVYIQAAPLGFMLKDQFMKKAGFDELIGDAWFEKSYARTDWGVDDKAFFEQAIERVVELHDRETPFFATLLTVGTHHPFTFPQGNVLEGGKDRRARAFRYADDALGDFLEALEERGVLQDTVVIITSDESAGLVDTQVSSVRLLAQSWSFAIVMLPEPEVKQVDSLYAHVDTALSIADLLGLENEARSFVGRSWFRDYESPRSIFGGNTYARRVIMWTPSEQAIVCDEAFDDCKRYGMRKSKFNPKIEGKPAFPRERRLLAEVARLTRSGRAGMDPSDVMALLALDEASIAASDGKRLLTGGQYLRVPAGTILRVGFDIEVEGSDAEVELHQDVFLNGRERFARKAKRIADGQRWQLEYEIHVPTPSDQLVVQLYATTVSGEAATLRFRSAELSMRRGADADPRVNVLVDDVSTAAH
jgi:phosphoglycerol transferase MdoB-like AlkP superfamily enzyme